MIISAIYNPVSLELHRGITNYKHMVDLTAKITSSGKHQEKCTFKFCVCCSLNAI